MSTSLGWSVGPKLLALRRSTTSGRADGGEIAIDAAHGAHFIGGAIEAGDSDLLRDTATGPSKERPDRNLVKEDGVGLIRGEPRHERIKIRSAGGDERSASVACGNAALPIEERARPEVVRDVVVKLRNDEGGAAVTEAAHLLEGELHIVEAVEIRAVHLGGLEVGAETGDGKALAGKWDGLIVATGKAEKHAANAARAQCSLEPRGVALVIVEREDLDAESKRRGTCLDTLEFPPANLLRTPVLAPAITGDQGDDIDLPRPAAAASIGHEGADERIGAIAELGGDGANALAGLDADAGIVAQSAGNRGRGDGEALRDFRHPDCMDSFHIALF